MTNTKYVVLGSDGSTFTLSHPKEVNEPQEPSNNSKLEPETVKLGTASEASKLYHTPGVSAWHVASTSGQAKSR